MKLMMTNAMTIDQKMASTISITSFTSRVEVTDGWDGGVNANPTAGKANNTVKADAIIFLFIDCFLSMASLNLMVANKA